MNTSVVILLLILNSLIVPQKDSVVVLQTEKEEYVELTIVNKNIFPVTIELDAELRNLKPSRSLPLITVIRAKNQRQIIQLHYDNLQEGWNLKVNYSWYVGSILAQPDKNFAYRLPFKKSTSFKLSQGYNGSFSHQGDQKYALDFVMPEGTAVYAARDGIVIMTQSRYSEGGDSEEFNSKANFVSILHKDGTIADYSHLKQNGVTVEKGQRVRAGQIIGFSGATGYVNGPHLHFVVKKAVKGGGFQSVPVKFTTRHGILDKLEEGEFYTGY